MTDNFKQYLLMVLSFCLIGGAVYTYQDYKHYNNISISLASTKEKVVYQGFDGKTTRYHVLGDHGSAKQVQKMASSSITYSVVLGFVGVLVLVLLTAV